MSSIIRARSGLMGWWEASEVIRGASLELKVAGPSMLGIRRPDRHALPLATSPTRRQRFTHPPPAGAGSFHASEAVTPPTADIGRCCPEADCRSVPGLRGKLSFGRVQVFSVGGARQLP